MSHYIQAYLIDAGPFKKLYGAKNPAALAKLTTMLGDDLDDLDDQFSEETNDTRNASQVLADIMNAEVRFPEIAFMYGYVYEKLCARFGKQQFPPNDEYSVDYWKDIEKEPYKTFFPLPRPDGIPEMYSIAVDELAIEKERFLKPTQRNGVSADDFEMEKEDYEYIFNMAIKEKKDLVFFLS